MREVKIRKEPSRWLCVDITDTIMVYVDNRTERYQRTKFRAVLDDIVEMAGLCCHLCDQNLTWYVNHINKMRIINHYNKKQAMCEQIRYTKTQYCKSCRKNRCLVDFENMKTCTHCRWKYRLRKVKKNITKRIEAFLEACEINDCITMLRLEAPDDINLKKLVEEVIRSMDIDDVILTNLEFSQCSDMDIGYCITILHDT